MTIFKKNEKAPRPWALVLEASQKACAFPFQGEALDLCGGYFILVNKERNTLIFTIFFLK